MRFVPYVAAAAGFLGGAWLVGVWLFGIAVMVVSVVFALVYDDRPKPKPGRVEPGQGRTIRQVFDDYRRAA